MEQNTEYPNQALTLENCEEIDRILYERAPLDEAQTALAIYTSTGSLDPISADALQRGIDVIALPLDGPNRRFGFINHLAYLDTMSRIVPSESDDAIDQIELRIHETVIKVTNDLGGLIAGRLLSAEDLANAENFIKQAHALSVSGCSFGKTTLHIADN